jgi:hypothetical protein
MSSIDMRATYDLTLIALSRLVTPCASSAA